MSRWPLFCCRQKLDKLASHPSSTKVSPFSISAPPPPPGQGGGEEERRVVPILWGSYGTAQVDICSEHAQAYQRDGTPKKGHTEKVIFVMASFCTLNILYVGSIFGPNFMLPLSLAESLGCLQIGVKKSLRLGLQQGSLF